MSSFNNGVDEDAIGEEMRNLFEENEEQDNSGLTDYKYFLEQLHLLETKVINRKVKLSPEEQTAKQNEINNLFEQAKNKVNETNVNQTYRDYTLLEFAARFGDINTINVLIGEIYLPTLLKAPEQLGDAIYWAARNNHTEALEKLLTAQGVLDAVIKKCSRSLSFAIRDAAKNIHTDALEKLLAAPGVLDAVINKYPKELGDAIYWAASNNHTDALEKLLAAPDVLDAVIEKCPEQLVKAIKSAVINNSYQALNLLVTNHILKEVIKKCPNELIFAIAHANTKIDHQALRVLLKQEQALIIVHDKLPYILVNAIKHAAENKHHQFLKALLKAPTTYTFLCNERLKLLLSIEGSIKQLSQDKDFEEHAAKYLNQINFIKNFTTVAIAGLLGIATAGIPTAVMSGTFVSALAAQKGYNISKDTRLVVNYLLPLCNKINKYLMNISPKLDLNIQAKAFTNPKIAGLIIGSAAIFGVICALITGVVMYKVQEDRSIFVK